MSEINHCPLCGSKHLKRCDTANNDQYFLFISDEKWICRNCGCFFSEKEAARNRMTATKISKKEFFEIIFDGLYEILKQELTKENKKKVEEIYKKNIKSYYKEVAEMQVQLFYENDCAKKELWLLEALQRSRIKDFLDE